MKRIIAILFILVAFGAKAQNSYPSFLAPIYSPYPKVLTGNMVNITNAYAGLGALTVFNNSWLDTFSTTGTTTNFYFYIGQNGANTYPVITPWVAVDTFIPMSVPYGGSMSFIVNLTKITGTPAGSVTVEESGDGYTWGPIHGSETKVISAVTTGTVTAYNSIISPDTMSISNVATLQAYDWQKPQNYTPYKRIKLNLTGTQSISAKATFTMIKN